MRDVVYLAEGYLARSRADELAAIARRLETAARVIAAGGTSIRFLRSTFVPEDETCFHVFEASSAVAVEEASARAGVGLVRVLQAIGEESNPQA